MLITSKANYRKLANITTVFRIFLGLPIAILLFFDNVSIAWFLLLFGGFTDWLDGWAARKGGGGSNWGAQADPLADKIILLAPIIWLVQNNFIPLWSAWILIGREYIVTAWRKNDNNGAPASISAKAKTMILFVSIIFIMWPAFMGGSVIATILKMSGIIFYWISLFMAVISAYRYFKNQVS